MTKKILAAVLAAFLFMMPIGCSSAQVAKAVSLVAAELPTALSLAQAVLAVVGAAQGQAAIVVPTSQIQGLETLCNQYTANPSSSVYQQIVSEVDTLVTNGDQALLQAASIKDPATQAKVTAVLGSLDAVLHIIDGYVQATQSTKAVKATAARRKAKLKAISQFWTDQQKQEIQNAFGEPYQKLYDHEVALGF